MKLHHFLNAVEHARIHQAIRDAEQGTSGDIVLYISHRRVKEPVAEADKVFRKLGLETAAKKDSLLLFLAPKSQKFAVVGGTALHEKVGQAWWDELVLLLAGHLIAGRYTEGLLAAIDRAGSALKTHFPDDAPDRHGQRDIVED